MAALLLIVFLPSKPTNGDVKAKLKAIDYFGCVSSLAATILLLIGLTWGGITYPWVSAQGEWGVRKSWQERKPPVHEADDVEPRRLSSLGPARGRRSLGGHLHGLGRTGSDASHHPTQSVQGGWRPRLASE